MSIFTNKLYTLFWRCKNRPNSGCMQALWALGCRIGTMEDSILADDTGLPSSGGCDRELIDHIHPIDRHDLAVQ